MPFKHHVSAIVWIQMAFLGTLPLTIACSRQPAALASTPPESSSSQKSLSFTPGSNPGGITPTHSLPSSALPRGTRLVVRLQSSLSSAASRPGDAFNAVLADPVVVRGETLLPSGAGVTGRVVSASASDKPFLQLTLSSVQIGSQTLDLHTSAVFVTVASHADIRGEPNDHAAADFRLVSPSPESVGKKSNPVKFSTGRQLTFWLVQNTTLPTQIVPN